MKGLNNSMEGKGITQYIGRALHVTETRPTTEDTDSRARPSLACRSTREATMFLIDACVQSHCLAESLMDVISLRGGNLWCDCYMTLIRSKAR